MYKEQFSQGWENQNLQKDLVSEEIKNVVRKKLSREIEFYEFCKERLKTQLNNIRSRRNLP